MRKVQSSALIASLPKYIDDPNRRVVPLGRSRSSTRESFVMDGPFTESKESCMHVALLARMKGSIR